MTVLVHHVVDELNHRVKLAKFDHFFVVFEAYLKQGKVDIILRVRLEGGSHIIKCLIFGESVQAEARKSNSV
jgi:hypothetical protein